MSKVNNTATASNSILDRLSEEQRLAMYESYCKLQNEHDLSERRIMRMLKLKEYELKALLTLVDK